MNSSKTNKDKTSAEQKQESEQLRQKSPMSKDLFRKLDESCLDGIIGGGGDGQDTLIGGF